MKPMPPGLALLFFGLPAIALVIGFHAMMPALIAKGMLAFYAYFVGIGVPLTAMLLTSLIAYRIDGYRMNWAELKVRFRLYRMDRRSWLWVGGILLVMILGIGLLSQVEQLLIDEGLMPVSTGLPAFLDPRNPVPPRLAFDEAFGGLKGNWFGLGVFAVLLVINILGEEFWWRGYVLPRQEVVHGRWTWVVHGSFWACFHVFKWWDILSLIPVTFALSYMVCRLRNTTTGIVVHLLFNGVGSAGLLFWVLGLGS
jgi:membrane protease YdiL (CAAX protease family)